MPRSLSLDAPRGKRQEIEIISHMRMRYIQYGFLSFSLHIIQSIGLALVAFVGGGLLAMQSESSKGASSSGSVPIVGFVVLIILLTPIAYFFGMPFYQLKIKRYFQPGKSFGFFRQTEPQLKRICLVIAAICGIAYIASFIFLRSYSIFRSLNFNLGMLTFSFGLVSVLLKIHGEIDHMASSELQRVTSVNQDDFILACKTYDKTPRPGSKLVGFTRSAVYAVKFTSGDNFNVTDNYDVAIIPLDKVCGVGLRTVSRKISFDTFGYIPNSISLMLKTNDGNHYAIRIDSTDGYQTNCFLFANSVLKIFDALLSDDRLKDIPTLGQKNIKKVVRGSEANLASPTTLGINDKSITDPSYAPSSLSSNQNSSVSATTSTQQKGRGRVIDL